jgi:hypothetical protein
MSEPKSAGVLSLRGDVRTKLGAVDERLAHGRRRSRIFSTNPVFFDEPGAPSRNEQLSAFKAERGAAPSDLIHEVTVTFA